MSHDVSLYQFANPPRPERSGYGFWLLHAIRRWPTEVDLEKGLSSSRLPASNKSDSRECGYQPCKKQTKHEKHMSLSKGTKYFQLSSQHFPTKFPNNLVGKLKNTSPAGCRNSLSIGAYACDQNFSERRPSLHANTARAYAHASHICAYETACTCAYTRANAQKDHQIAWTDSHSDTKIHPFD